MITNIINFFQRLYQDNPSVAAILGVSSAGIATSILYICRNNITSLFYWIKKQLTTSFYITNEQGSDEAYDLILKWLKQYNKLYTRSLKSPRYFSVDDLQKDNISDALQYGIGKHLIWYNKSPIWIFVIEEKMDNSIERKMSLTLTTLGRKHNLIYNLLDEVYRWNENIRLKNNKDKT